jgi:hypothetical protein
MNEEQKFFFDTSGYLVLEDILLPDRCEHLIEELKKIIETPKEQLPRGLSGKHNRESCETGVGDLSCAGPPFTDLIDLPPVIDILQEVIYQQLRLETAYGYIRQKGFAGLNLHGGGHWNGGGQDYNFMYRHFNGSIFCANTVVGFVLTAGGEDEGFACIPGSHKANFPIPNDWKDIRKNGVDRSLVRIVAAPAGSAVIFPEALCHGASPWTGDSDRISLFYKYNHIGMKWRHSYPTKEALERMTPNQRLFFTEVASDTRSRKEPVIHPGR